MGNGTKIWNMRVGQKCHLQLDVDRGVVVPDVGLVLHAVDAVGGDVGVAHGDQRDLESHHPGHVASPRAGAVYHAPEKATVNFYWAD